MLQRITKLCFLLLIIINYCNGANILYVIPFTSKSHYIMLRPIGLELAKRGHNVTVITANKEVEHPPNYHQVMIDNKEIWEAAGMPTLLWGTAAEIESIFILQKRTIRSIYNTDSRESLGDLFKEIGGKRPNVFSMVELSTEEFHDKILWGGGLAFTEVALNSSDVKEFLKTDHTFDLVIAEQFFQESMYMLAHKYNAPLVLVTTFGNCMRHNIVTRNPLQVATVVSEFLDVKNPTSFFGRLRNFYFTIYEFIWWKYWYLEKHEDLVRKYIPNIPEPTPSLYELQRNSSLMLINSHFSFDSPVAYGPNIVEIGGIHLTRSAAPLPKDLQEILDGAKHGVIYVNFGSNIRSSELPVEKKNAFLNIFRELKQIVIWKWEEEILENKPINLIIRKWLPQKEIFSHPNVRLFISHGGLIGTQEAIFHGIPIVGIPIYCDQYNNLLQVEEMGFGKILQYKDINEINLKSIVKEVLIDNSYRNNAQKMSARFKDRPLSAMDTAMFWIEYVIRNDGANYMRNSGLKLSWIENNMLDVYLFIIVALLIILNLIIRIFKMLIGSVVMKDRKKQKRY